MECIRKQCDEKHTSHGMIGVDVTQSVQVDENPFLDDEEEDNDLSAIVPKAIQ